MTTATDINQQLVAKLAHSQFVKDVTVEVADKIFVKYKQKPPGIELEIKERVKSLLRDYDSKRGGLPEAGNDDIMTLKSQFTQHVQDSIENMIENYWH